MPAFLVKLGPMLLSMLASEAFLQLVIIGIRAKAKSYQAKTRGDDDPTNDAYGDAAVEAVGSLQKFAWFWKSKG